MKPLISSVGRKQEKNAAKLEENDLKPLSLYQSK